MQLTTLETRRSSRRQAGMTTMGLIILVLFVGIFAFAGIRLTPVYLNYMKVLGVVNGVVEEFDGAGGLVGHAGLVVFDDTVDMAQQARFAMEFCAVESCGKCTPCRVGSVRGVEVIDRIIAGRERESNLELLDELCDTMDKGSLCAMGGLTPMPVRSAVAHFPEDFGG
jgi:hypothetical protein